MDRDYFEEVFVFIHKLFECSVSGSRCHVFGGAGFRAAEEGGGDGAEFLENLGRH